MIKHENIVTYHGHEKIDGNFYIYLEYISGGMLYKNWNFKNNN
jgi:serine/threonine protein kinase